MFSKKKSTSSAAFSKVQGKPKHRNCPNCKDGKIGNKNCVACKGLGKRWIYPGEKEYKKL